jgi:hypothetical protein
MGHRKLSPLANGKPRRAGALLSLGIALSILSFLVPSYDFQPVASFSIAACNKSDDEPPDALIFLQEPPSYSENEFRAVWETGFNFDSSLFLERAAIENWHSTLPFCFHDLTPRLSRFKLLVLTPRSPPIYQYFYLVYL